ncbi:hypothetical protein MHYP_G00111650 [Metynnis hypsauchen]
MDLSDWHFEWAVQTMTLKKRFTEKPLVCPQTEAEASDPFHADLPISVRKLSWSVFLFVPDHHRFLPLVLPLTSDPI